MAARFEIIATEEIEYSAMVEWSFVFQQATRGMVW